MSQPEPSQPTPQAGPAAQHPLPQYGQLPPAPPVQHQQPPPGAYGPQPMYGGPVPIVVAAPKSPGVAVLLSLIWFGFGHLYADQTRAGIGLIVFDIFLGILAITVVGLVVAIPLWLVSLPFVLHSAYQAVNRFNQRNGLVMR
jgi:TM2 domain-containing membrane protein YozV